MIIRILPDNSVIKLPFVKDDDAFLAVNTTGGFQKVDRLPPSASQKWVMVDGEIISDPVADAEVEANMYKDARVVEYPSIGDQLDALYHAGVFPEDMAAKIKEVKDKYPKV